MLCAEIKSILENGLRDNIESMVLMSVIDTEKLRTLVKQDLLESTYVIVEDGDSES